MLPHVGNGETIWRFRLKFLRDATSTRYNSRRSVSRLSAGKHLKRNLARPALARVRLPTHHLPTAPHRVRPATFLRPARRRSIYRSLQPWHLSVFICSLATRSSSCVTVMLIAGKTMTLHIIKPASSIKTYQSVRPALNTG